MHILLSPWKPGPHPPSASVRRCEWRPGSSRATTTARSRPRASPPTSTRSSFASERYGPRPLGSLAALLGMDRSTLSREIAPLVEAGLIDATADAADRRRRVLTVTRRRASSGSTRPARCGGGAGRARLRVRRRAHDRTSRRVERPRGSAARDRPADRPAAPLRVADRDRHVRDADHDGRLPRDAGRADRPAATGVRLVARRRSRSRSRSAC